MHLRNLTCTFVVQMQQRQGFLRQGPVHKFIYMYICHIFHVIFRNWHSILGVKADLQLSVSPSILTVYSIFQKILC